ncbi:hypothetical protein QUB70_15560 [Microcoleus sp. A003_D6]
MPTPQENSLFVEQASCLFAKSATANLNKWKLNILHHCQLPI